MTGTRGKKTLSALVFAAGLATLAGLLWKIDASAVWALVASVGWGFVLIFSQEIVAHLFNAYGWRFAYTAQESGFFSLRELLRLRIIGDGVNYLTPSAQLAGEFARASMLDPACPLETRLSGVVVAKFSQGLAQFLFGLFGLALFLDGRIPALAPFEGALRALAALVVLLLAAFIAYERFRSGDAARASGPVPEAAAAAATLRSALGALPGRVRRYLAESPGRFSLSIVFFLLGFAWGAFEVFWVCRFLGFPVGLGAAVAIESLSCIIDGILFMVPAKAGTQEAGKTAIFVLLGMPARAGLAFGIIRHIRELAWAALGLGLYSPQLRSRAAGSEPKAPRPEPALT